MYSVMVKQSCVSRPSTDVTAFIFARPSASLMVAAACGNMTSLPRELVSFVSSEIGAERCPQPFMRGISASFRPCFSACAFATSSLARMIHAAPSVIWPQSSLRTRPSITGLRVSSAPKLPSANCHPRVWALGFNLALAKFISAMRVKCSSRIPCRMSYSRVMRSNI